MNKFLKISRPLVPLIISEVKKNEIEKDLRDNFEKELYISTPFISEIHGTRIMIIFFLKEMVPKNNGLVSNCFKKIDELWLKSNCTQSKISNFFHRM